MVPVAEILAPGARRSAQCASRADASGRRSTRIARIGLGLGQDSADAATALCRIDCALRLRLSGERRQRRDDTDDDKTAPVSSAPTAAPRERISAAQCPRSSGALPAGGEITRSGAHSVAPRGALFAQRLYARRHIAAIRFDVSETTSIAYIYHWTGSDCVRCVCCLLSADGGPSAARQR